MGRTLHFKIVKDNRKPYNEKEFNGIVAVTNKYNTGEFEGVWTCENFHANPLDYYPNWNAGSNWDKILVRQDQLVAEGVSLFNVIKAMHKEKLICFHDEEHIETGIACGFVKVQGNEFNSLLVLTALVEISVLMPHATISLSDEGRFLICDIALKNGKVKPDIEGIRRDIDRYGTWIAFADESVRNAVKSDGIHPGLLDDVIPTGHTREDAIGYINEKLRDLAMISEVIAAEESKGTLRDVEINAWNIGKHWFENPFAFSRKVNIESFKDYKCSAATLMDGFSGEAFGLSNEDSEEKSYKSIAQIQKLFAGMDVEVLPHVQKGGSNKK